MAITVANSGAAHFAEGLGINGGTSAAHNLSGADLLVLSVSYSTGTSVTTADLSDSLANTWRQLTAQTTFDSFVRLFYAWNASAGAAQTFTVTKTSGAIAIAVIGFAGSQTASDPFDVETGAGSASAVTSLATGSVTPSVANEVIVTGLANYVDTSAVSRSINSGFTLTDQIGFSGASYFPAAIAYLIETTATAQNPTWSWSAANQANTAIATFKAAAGGPTAPTYPQLERGIRGLARGVAGGIARSFVRRDRIFVPSYAMYDLKAAA